MAQSFPSVAGAQRVRESRAPLLDRDEALRSQFSGEEFPTSPAPVQGQMCFRTDQAALFQYIGTAWVQIFPPDNSDAPTLATLQRQHGLGGGAVSRSAAVITSDWANARDWGYVADGTSAAHSALQAAVNAVAAAGGGRVILPRGVGVIGATVGLLNNVTLEGEGPGATRLRAAAGLNSPILGATSRTGFAVRGLTLDGNASGNSSGAHALSLYSCEAFSLADLEITNTAGSAAILESSAQGAYNRGGCKRFTVRDIALHNIDHHGIYIAGATDGVVSGVRGRECRQTLLELSACDRIVGGDLALINAAYPNRGYAALRIANTTQECVINGVTVDTADRALMLISGARRNSVLGLRARNLGAEGILINTSGVTPRTERNIVQASIRNSGQVAALGSRAGCRVDGADWNELALEVSDETGRLDIGVHITQNGDGNALQNTLINPRISGFSQADVVFTYPDRNFVVGGAHAGAITPIVAAATLALPIAGAAFVVSGASTTINAITGAYAGRVVTLNCGGNYTFANGPNLSIRGGSFSAQTGSTITLVYTTAWSEVSRSQ